VDPDPGPDEGLDFSGGNTRRYIANIDAPAPQNTPRIRSHGEVPKRESNHFPRNRKSRMATTN